MFLTVSDGVFLHYSVSSNCTVHPMPEIPLMDSTQGEAVLSVTKCLVEKKRNVVASNTLQDRGYDTCHLQNENDH